MTSYSPLLPCSCITAMLEGKISSLFSNQINTTSVTSGAGTAYPSEAPEFTPRFLVGFVLLNLQFYVYVLQIVVCPFALLFLAIVLSVLLLFTDTDYPFGIFKLFLVLCMNITYKIKILIKFVSYLRQVDDFQLKYISFII